MKKILIIIGTRPEAIKMAPLFIKMRAQKNIRVEMCLTGQHKEMIEEVLIDFGIDAEYKLDVIRHGSGLCDLIGAIVIGLDKVLTEYEPNLVLVHGDTTTTLAASISAFYNRIAVGHVEAGLRTDNLSEPFPEEFNRRSVTVGSALHFCPTKLSKSNLIHEGINEQNIFVTGNTVVDALMEMSERIVSGGSELVVDEQYYITDYTEISKFTEYVLITTHRRENIGQGLENIITAVQHLANKYPELYFVLPVHLNPNIYDVITHRLGAYRNIILLKPLPYRLMVGLMMHCRFVMTDSGGIQEEAPTFQKPVLVMRNTTERPEGIDAGCLRLVGTSSKDILKNAEELISSDDTYQSMSNSANPYGDGKACERILSHILEFLN